MSLRVYNRKRRFDQTPEPKGKIKKRGGALRFVVQMHDASRLHYDFRLEFGGVYKSWAVPKGPSLNPLDQRLAVFVEDHPLDYGTFEGIIPKGNYGAGTVMVWDQGTYVERGSKGRQDSEAAMIDGLAKGHITFVLDGEKLKGEFALIRLKKDESQKAWLLVKKRDEFSTVKRTERPSSLSVKTGRTLEQIAEEAQAKGDVWLSHRGSFDREDRPKKKKPKKKMTIHAQVPLPRKIKPMLATLGPSELPKGEWIMDEDHGGLRAIAEVDGKQIHLHSKSLLPFERKFPKLIAELKKLNTQAVFDGEIEKKTQIFHVFDLLYLAGEDLRKRPLKERKSRLSEAFADSHLIRKTKSFRKTSKKPVVAKRADSLYHSGTTSDWLYIQPGIKAKEKSQIAGEAPLTNLDKIYFPDDGYTKGDVIEYYRQVAPYILPYLKDRPESLNRHPNGIKQPGFYQKDLTGHIPRWFQTEKIHSESSGKTIAYALIQDERSLLYCANLGCIELNPWFSRRTKLDKPDFLVIDLDPDENPFAHVVEVALAFHEVLNAIQAPNFVKTSGATGIHIGVPTGAKYDFDTVRDFAQKVCEFVHVQFPDTTSLHRNPNRRRGKIYLDYMQNRRGQTLAAPFCIRPRPGAPVSMPVMWKEVKKLIKPEQFNIENAPSRIAKFVDPWAGVLSKSAPLEKCLKLLERMTNKA